MDNFFVIFYVLICLIVFGYQFKQKGLIGFIEDGLWFELCKDIDEDCDVVFRVNEYWFGW